MNFNPTCEGLRRVGTRLTNAAASCRARFLIRRYAWQESASQGQTNVESKVYLITNRDSRWANVHAERSKSSPRISGKRQSTSDGYGDNRGGVCLDGATSFVNCQARPRTSVPRLFTVLQGAGWSNALLVIGPRSLGNRNQAQDAPFEETSHGRHINRLDRSHHHWRSCRLAGRTVHEEWNGNPDEYRARCHRGGGCQRHFELLWDSPRGMDRLPGRRVHRRGLADLDRTGGTGDTPASLRPTNGLGRQVRNIPHLVAEGRSN